MDAVKKISPWCPQFQGAPLEFADVLADLNLIFTAMFTVECALKISSFGPKVIIAFSLLNKVMYIQLCLYVT